MDIVFILSNYFWWVQYNFYCISVGLMTLDIGNEIIKLLKDELCELDLLLVFLVSRN